MARPAPIFDIFRRSDAPTWRRGFTVDCLEAGLTHALLPKYPHEPALITRRGLAHGTAHLPPLTA